MDFPVSYLVPHSHTLLLKIQPSLVTISLPNMCVLQAAVAVYAIICSVRGLLQGGKVKNGSHRKCNLLRHLPTYLHRPAHLCGCSPTVATLVVTKPPFRFQKCVHVSTFICLVKEGVPDHWDYSRQHLGPLSFGVVAGLWISRDPSFLLALIFSRLSAGQDLFQSSKNGY